MIMKSALKVGLIFLLLLFLQLNKVSAQDEGGGGYTTPTCPGNLNNLTWDEFVDRTVTPNVGAITLHWQEYTSYPVISYKIYWNSIPNSAVTNCPAGSPQTTCGKMQYNTSTSGQNNVLLTNLTPGQKYNISIYAYHNGSYCATNPPNYDPATGYYSYLAGVVWAIPTYCGDNIKGHAEVCDGSDAGGYFCSNVRYMNPAPAGVTSTSYFESGNLTCSSDCQTITTTSCTSCNSISSIKTDNGIANSDPRFIPASATFKCLVTANRAGAGIGCNVVSSTGGDPIANSSTQVVSSCPFVSWQGATAEFSCTAPTQPPPNYSYYYVLATYPTSNSNSSYFSKDPNNSALTWGQVQGACNQQASNKSQMVQVKPQDSTPPTVTIVESSDEPYAPLSAYKNVTANIHCTDNSGCNSNTFKFKKFDTKLTACPTDYSQYTLPNPQPTALNTIWLCAAARDVFGNAGFSDVKEFRPGCRDQCSTWGTPACRQPQTSRAGVDYVSYCLNIDSDACLEWSPDGDTCAPYACSYNTCLSWSGDRNFGSAFVWEDKNGNGIQDPGENGLPNIGVKSERTTTSGYVTWRDNSYQTSVIEPVVPAGWSLVSTVCGYYQTTNGRCDSNNYTFVDQMQNGKCTMYGPLTANYSPTGNNYPSGFDSCGYKVAFGLAKINPNVQPTVTFTSSPPSGANTATGTLVTLTTQATDAYGVTQIQIFVDGAMVQSCNTPGTPTLSCEIKKIFQDGKHTYYAVAKNTAGNYGRTPQPDKDFTTQTVTNSQQCQYGNQVQNGLISAGGGVSGGFGNTPQQCVIGSQAVFAPFTIKTFNEIQSLYYNQK